MLASIRLRSWRICRLPTFTRTFLSSPVCGQGSRSKLVPHAKIKGDAPQAERLQPEHAVISTFDLFSIGGMFASSRVDEKR
jgi:hypothetical protein